MNNVYSRVARLDVHLKSVEDAVRCRQRPRGNNPFASGQAVRARSGGVQAVAPRGAAEQGHPGRGAPPSAFHPSWPGGPNKKGDGALFLRSGLKGLHTTAQGAALGVIAPGKREPCKGGTRALARFDSALTGLRHDGPNSLPRASPWAVVSQPFRLPRECGARATTQNTPMRPCDQVGRLSWAHTACPPSEKVFRPNRSRRPAAFKQWHTRQRPSRDTGRFPPVPFTCPPCDSDISGGIRLFPWHRACKVPSVPKTLLGS